MNLNWKEINRIIEELDLEGAQIQDCVQSDIHSIYLQCYKKREIWVHFHLKPPLICICEGKRPKRQTPVQRFQAFLLANIKNSYITAIHQHGKDRIIAISCTRQNRNFQCFITLWAGKENFIVCDTTLKIIEAYYRKPKQGIVAGMQYALPEISMNLAEKEIREHTPPLAQFIARELLDLHTEKGLQEKLHTQELLANEIHRLQRLLRTKEKQIPSNETIAELQHQAELFLTAHTSWRRGMESISVYDYKTNANRTIILRPQESFKENADILFQQVKKLQGRQKNISTQITALKQEIAEYTAAMQDSENPVSQAFIQKKLAKSKAANSAAARSKQPFSGRQYCIDGFNTYIGRNVQQNETLIRKIARGNDIWLHARDYPGAHVIIKRQKKTEAIPQQVLLRAAKLAFYFSKGRKNSKGDVYVCAVKHLRKKKHGVFGEFIPHQEKNLFVSIENIEALLHSA